MKPYGSRSSVSWMYSIKKLTTELWSLMGAGGEQVKCEALNVQYKETNHWAMKPYGSRSSVSWMYSIKKLTTELWSLMGAGQVWVECTV